MSDYQSDATNDAHETISEFKDTILEQLEENDKASEDLHNDYPDGDRWHHESHIDKWYSLTNAAELINELSEHEETDSGLWEGQQPKDAVGTCAAYTYGNAVLSEWRYLIDELNREAETILEDYDEQINDAEDVLEEAEEAEDNNNKDYDGLTSGEAEEKIEQLKVKKKIALEVLIDQIAQSD